MADQSLEMQLVVEVNDAEAKLDTSFDKMGKSWERVLKKVSDEMSLGFKETSRGFDDLEKALSRSEKAADSLRTKFAGSGEEIQKLIGHLSDLNDAAAKQPEVAKIREDRDATPAGQHNLAAAGIQNEIKDLAELDKVGSEVAASQEAAWERFHTAKKQWASEERREFDDKEKQSSAELQREIDKAGRMDALDQQRIADAQKLADADKASADKAAQQQERLNAEYQKADDYLSEQAKAMRDMGDSGLQAAADIEQLRVELQELSDLRSVSAGGGGGPGSPPDDDLENLKKVHKYRLDAIKEEQKVAAKAHAAGNQDHKERLDNAKLDADSHSLLARSKYANDAEYLTKAGHIFKRHYQQLAALEIESTGLSRNQVEVKLRNINAVTDAELRKIQEVAQARKNQGYFDATGLNKANQALYNVQQTIEDFSYAGLRGATNNLAFLSQTIGGPVGIAAMFSVMTLNVLSTTGALGKFADWTGITTEKTKEETAALDQAIDRFIALQDLKEESAVGRRSAEPMSLVTDKIEKEVRLREIANEEEKKSTVIKQRQVALYEQMEEKAKALHKLQGDRWFTNPRKPEDILNDPARNYTPYKSNGTNLKAAEPTKEELAAQEVISDIQELSKEYLKLAPNSQLSAGAVKQFSEELTKSDVAIAAHIEGLKDLDELRKLSKDLEPLVDTAKGLSKSDSFGTVSSDDRAWTARVDRVNSGVEGAGGKAYTEELKRQKTALQENLDLILKESNKAADRLQTEGKTTNEIKARVQEGNDAMSQAGAKALAAAEATRERAEAISKTVKSLEEAEKSIQHQISDTERLIDTENKHLASIEQAESARQDSEERRRSAAKDRIEDLRTGEKVESIDKGLAANKEWASNRKHAAEDWAENNLQGKRNTKAKEAFKHRLDAEYSSYLNMLDKKAVAYKEHAEKEGNAAKQKNLDATKQKLGGEAQEQQHLAKANQEWGNFEKAQEHIDKARHKLEELQKAQERVIGKGTVAQAEQAQKDMDATGKKLEALSQQERELAKARGVQATQDVAKLQGLLKDVVDQKTTASNIKLNDPKEAEILNGVVEGLKQVLALKQQIAAVQAQGAAPGGGGVAGGQGGGGVAGGGGQGPRQMFSPTINVNHNGSSASSMAQGLAMFVNQARASTIRMG